MDKPHHLNITLKQAHIMAKQLHMVLINLNKNQYLLKGILATGVHHLNKVDYYLIILHYHQVMCHLPISVPPYQINTRNLLLLSPLLFPLHHFFLVMIIKEVVHTLQLTAMEEKVTKRHPQTSVDHQISNLLAMAQQYQICQGQISYNKLQLNQPILERRGFSVIPQY